MYGSPPRHLENSITWSLSVNLANISVLIPKLVYPSSIIIFLVLSIDPLIKDISIGCSWVIKTNSAITIAALNFS